MAVERYDRVVADRCEPLTLRGRVRVRGASPGRVRGGARAGARRLTDAAATSLGLARERSGPADEVALRQTERRFAALVEHSSDMVAVLDAEAAFLYGSPAVTRVLGWPSGIPPTTLMVRVINGSIFLHPDDRVRDPRVDRGPVPRRTSTTTDASSGCGAPTGRGAGSRRSARTGSTTRPCAASS